MLRSFGVILNKLNVEQKDVVIITELNKLVDKYYLPRHGHRFDVGFTNHPQHEKGNTQDCNYCPGTGLEINNDVINARLNLK